MRDSSTLLPILLLLSALAVMSGCGKKGPLYLPAPAAAHAPVKTPAAPVDTTPKSTKTQ